MFKALVRSRLEYAAEVWAPTSFLWPQADKIQLKWVRAVWNLPPNSSTMAPLCELTLWPLILRRHYLRLSFLWSLSHSSASSIHYQLFAHRVKSLALGAKAAASDWLLSTHHLLSTLELEHVLDNNASALMELHSDAWKSMCKKGLLANLTEQWHDYLDKHSYLSTYRELSPDFLTRLPAYLHTALAANVVAPVMSLSLAASELLIDSGRCLGLSRPERVCRGCGVDIESVEHLFICSALDDCRSRLLQQIYSTCPILALSPLTTSAQFASLLRCDNVALGLCPAVIPTLISPIRRFVHDAVDRFRCFAAMP